ncbi:MAG: sulfatase-like hydrolase/transferase [Pirellulaceae bacterium]|nr:sulfatase-like hydrolase/transferase [Pirellulaceae bacterium]
MQSIFCPFLLMAAITIGLSSAAQTYAEIPPPSTRPNVLLISVDDLNDWVGCLGGHPQAKTPQIDRLASRGVIFTNAHCQAPVCNPSRASLMTSLYPSSTGIYFLNPDLAKSPVARPKRLMPARFLAEGYRVAAAGKLFHGPQNQKYLPNYAGNFGGFGPMPAKKLSPFPGHPLWDWGAYPDQSVSMPDQKIAAWAAEQIATPTPQPKWLGVGFFRPHVPQFAPQKWFDLHPLEDVKLPLTKDRDLDDIPAYGRDITRLKHIAPTSAWVETHDQQKQLVQSYLASVSFVDDQIGKVLDALDTSAQADNTFVVLFSDHGFHLGEKQRYAKRSLWRDSTRVPLIIAGPGIPAGRQCDAAVQLLDIYPTLLELTGLSPDASHEGHSLVPLLDNPQANWPYFARTSFGPGNYAITSRDYRYIQYNDGSEEFYDHRDDENELTNLIDRPEQATKIDLHRQNVPVNRHPILGQNSTGHHSYNATEAKHQPPVLPPQQANGIKIGEVQSRHAIVWTRLTQNDERNRLGTPFPNASKRTQSPKPKWNLAEMEGAAAGAKGQVRLKYWPQNTPQATVTTDWQDVDPEKDYTHQFSLTKLEPGTRYSVSSEARANPESGITSRVEGSFKTALNADQIGDVAFSVVTGQEYHRRDDVANGHKIYPQMQELGTDFFVHTGDIVYYDKAGPFADTLPLARFKWNRTYAMPFQRDFHNQTASYFMKDDHDTLKNDCWPGQNYGDISWEQGLQLFREQVPMGESTYRTIRWGRDLQIWLVEGRDFRSPNRMPDGPEKTIWGEEQKQWLFNSVKNSDATFRILISPTPIVGPDRGNKKDNHANVGFTHEGNEIRNFVSQQEDMYVVCGDRHWQYVSVDPVTGVREYSCGPTTNKHAGGFRKSDQSEMHRYLNIKGGFLRVEVNRDENGKPQAIFRHHDVNGNVLHEDRRTPQKNSQIP